ncbi:MAG: type II secretion system major pseudopilin GspG [Verrucomicrobiota bacterium]|jgi:general secretion pathway protein G
MKTKGITSKAAGRKMMRQGAFTLVEMLLVLTILAILAGIVIPKMSGRIPQAKITAAQTDIASFKTALGMYEVDTGGFPPGRTGLSALLVKPNNVQGWRGPYLEKDVLPVDPWQHPYVYEFPGKHNPSSYDIYSLGPTGQGGNDAIGNWTPRNQQ